MPTVYRIVSHFRPPPLCCPMPLPPRARLEQESPHRLIEVPGNMNRTLFLPLLALTLGCSTAAAAPKARPVDGYIADVPAERAEARAARHQEIARRRAQSALVIVHRGAAAFAPENTLEAYAA
ncbi:MAG: hypothetical protein K0Q72_4977, partial [Armatimonadetes bacterium]|nr:hypothetical protein [Armatimonadota bacterium]